MTNQESEDRRFLVARQASHSYFIFWEFVPPIKFLLSIWLWPLQYFFIINNSWSIIYDSFLSSSNATGICETSWWFKYHLWSIFKTKWFIHNEMSRDVVQNTLVGLLGLFRLGRWENIYGLYVSLSVVFYCYSCFWGLKLPILQVAFETSNGPFIFVNYKISIWEGIKIYRVILEEKGRYWVVLRPSVTLKTSKMSRVFNLGVNHEFKLVNHE